MNTVEAGKPALCAARDIPPAGRLALAIELVAVFALGIAVMTFLYAGTGGPSGAERGLPGYDDFYHVKMSVLMPRIGLIDQFPWLTTTIFAERFVNHHWAFQALMAPFVYASERLHGNWADGARWAITTFFALAMMLFDLLLITERVRFRWVWLGLFMVMPAQFFGRHVFIRAISLSLACMFAVIILMFRRRYVWCALVIALYVHIYLGALCYVPLLVGAYYFCGLVGADPQDRVSWKLLLWGGIGLAAGWLTHPYREGIFDFLKVQVFGSGLSPDISVGREWKSYEGKLWEVLFEYFGSTLSLLIVSIIARMRMGSSLNAREAAMLVFNFAFLVLAVRQRRFIEYWPPFGLLASAMLVAPLLDRLAEAWSAARWGRRPVGERPRDIGTEGPPGRGGEGERGRQEEEETTLLITHHSAIITDTTVAEPHEVFHQVPDRRTLLLPAGFVFAFLAWAAATLFLVRRGPALGLEPFVREWRVWAFVIGLVALSPFLSIWSDAGPANGRQRWLRGGANLLCGAALTALTLLPVVWVFRKSAVLEARMWLPVTLAGVLVAAYVALVRAAPAPFDDRPVGRQARGLRAATGVFGGAAFAIFLVMGAGAQLVDLQRSSRCGFDLPAVRAAMNHLKSVSAEGSIVFTDDWDIFPVFFYHNHHNRFIVGLDPMFSHSHDPVLYARYVKITQSKKFPATAEAEVKDASGVMKKESVEVRLEDIRDHFHAEYVVVDPDHKGIAKHLEAAPELAERIFPADPRDKDHWPPYTIYRIKPNEEWRMENGE